MEKDALNRFWQNKDLKVEDQNSQISELNSSWQWNSDNKYFHSCKLFSRNRFFLASQSKVDIIWEYRKFLKNIRLQWDKNVFINGFTEVTQRSFIWMCYIVLKHKLWLIL
jgi:hypothetical protein